MRKISRAEEQYNSLNFRTADAEPWGQKEHFRIVDSDTPVTEGGPKCEGCGGKMQEHGEGSVCRNRRCNKRDMVINASKTASDKPWDEEDPDGGDHDKLSSEEKASAKARAKAHGRPYPNWVDNAWASKK
jgi:hypothetical protein